MNAKLLFLIVLLGCASSARIEQPLVLDFRSKSEEIQALAIRNAFESRFAQITLGDDRNAPARVALTITEAPRAIYAEGMRARGDNTVQSSSSHRCGTVAYIVYASAKEIARDEFPLDCDSTGRSDYRRAGLRAAEAVARALTTQTVH